MNKSTMDIIFLVMGGIVFFILVGTFILVVASVFAIDLRKHKDTK